MEKLKKIVLQTESCIGCGACVGIDSEHFEFSDDGFSVVKSQENLESPALNDAIDACPVAIISLEEVQEEVNSNVTSIHTKDSHNQEDCQCDPCHCKDCHCHEEEVEEEEKAA